jgi:tape measure domain-containing protein
MEVGALIISLQADIARLQKDMDKVNRIVGSSMSKVESAAKMATRALGGLGISLGALATGRYLINTLDEFTKFNALLKNATKSQAEFNVVFADAQRIGKQSQTSLTAVSTLYSRLLNNTRDLGVSQKQVGSIVETVALSLKAQGTSTQEAASAMQQLSQAFGKGRLDGDELKTMLEAAPPLMRALAESINVPFGALKDLGAQGKLTAEVMLKAWSDPALMAAFAAQAKEARTLSGAWQTLKDDLTVAIGEFDKSTGISKLLTVAINDVALAIEAVTAAAKGVPIDIIGRLLPSYQGYRERMDKEGNESRATPGGSILPTGARMDQFIRRDIGAIGQLDQAYKDLKTRTDGFRKDNPLKDSIAENEKIAENLKLIQEAQDKGLISVQIADRYRNQLNEDAYKKQSELSKKLNEERLKDLQKEIDFEEDMRETRAKVESDASEEARKQLEKDEKYRADFMMKRNEEISEAYLRTVKEQNDKAQREYDRFYDRLSQSISDALFRGFEKGKDFLQNFKDTALHAFQTLVLQPRIEMLVKGSGIGSLFGVPGVAGASEMTGSSGGLGGIGNIFSIGKSLTSGFSGIQSSITGGIEKLGVMLTTGNGGFLDSLGGFMGANAGTIGNALPFAGAALQALSGDIKGAAFTAVGSAIGLAFGMPAIGGMVGGLVGSMFGSSGERFKTQGEGRIGTFQDGKFTGKQTAFSGSQMSGVAKSMDALNETFSKNLSMVLDAFGKSDRVVTNNTVRLRRTSGSLATKFKSVFSGGSINEKGQFGQDADIASAFKEYANKVLGEYMVKAIKATDIPSVIKKLFDGMSSSAVVGRMVVAVTRLGSASEQLSDRFGITVGQTAKMAKETGLMGDELSRFVRRISNAALKFMTLGEQLVDARLDLEKRFGGGLPESLNAYDKALKDINTTTVEGRAEFARLLAIRGQFKEYTAAIDGLKSNVKGALFPMLSGPEQQAQMQADLAKMFGDLNMDVPGSIAELVELGKSIDYTTEAGINLAAVFPSLVQAFQQTQGVVNGLMDSLMDMNRFSTLVDFKVYQGIGRNYGASAANDYLANLPSYDVGTSYVPSTGPKMIHEGERILTKNENANFTRDSAQLVGEMRALNAKVDRLAYSMDKTASSTKRTADIMANITPNGDALVTEAAA